MYGPVPIGWLASDLGSEPAGAKPLTRMAENFSGRTGSGLLSVSLMVFLSTTAVLAMAAYHDANGLPVAGSIIRSTFHLASSAENGWPLWNITFWPQVEHQLGGRRVLPGGGQRRLGVHRVRVHPGEGLVDQPLQVAGGCVAARVRVEADRIGDLGPGERAAAFHGRGGGGRRRGGGGRRNRGDCRRCGARPVRWLAAAAAAGAEVAAGAAAAVVGLAAGGGARPSAPRALATGTRPAPPGQLRRHPACRESRGD